MSLEDAINQNTTAVLALTAALNRQDVTPAADRAAAKPEPVKSEAVEPVEPVKVEKKKPGRPAAPKVAVDAREQEDITVPEVIEAPLYEQIVNHIKTLVKEDNEPAAVKILARYGAKKAPQIKEEDYAAALADFALAVASLSTEDDGGSLV